MTKAGRIARRIIMATGGVAPLTIADVYRRLEQSGRQHAVPLMDAICARAREDAEYGEALSGWLADGGTLVLRDELCAPFKGADLFEGSERRYPWFDAFTALDSVSAGRREA